MLEFDDFIYHESLVPKGEEEKKKFFDDLEQKFAEEVKNSPKAKAHFEKFKAWDVPHFINGYARAKASVARHYRYYNLEYRELEEYEYKFHERAEAALHLILQKKLFNIQLQWRAGRLKFESNLDDLSRPGLDVCIDFTFWEHNIASCPFIDPVTVHEKDIMKEYLMTVVPDRYGSDIDDGCGDCQCYDLFMEKDEDGDLFNMPDWYEFYDLRMGTGSLLILPNLREEKEDFYVHLSRDNQRSATSAPLSEPEEDNRPGLFGYGQDIIDFAKVYETDKYFVQLFKGYAAEFRKKNRSVAPEEIEYAVEDLTMADRNVTLPAHLNWDEALVYAAKKYKNIKTAEALDIVYDEYLMRLELGITTTGDIYDVSETYLNISRKIKEAVLKGRVKNGEPANFDY